MNSNPINNQTRYVENPYKYCRYTIKKQECPFNDSCFYAHTQQEFISSNSNNKKITTTGAPVQEQNVLLKHIMCNNIEKCPFGAFCRYAHSEQELIKKVVKKDTFCNYIKLGEMCPNIDNGCPYKHVLEEKCNLPCKQFVKSGECKYGLVCKYQHITKVEHFCNKVRSDNTCEFGEKCVYLHDYNGYQHFLKQEEHKQYFEYDTFEDFLQRIMVQLNDIEEYHKDNIEYSITLQQQVRNSLCETLNKTILNHYSSVCDPTFLYDFSVKLVGMIYESRYNNKVLNELVSQATGKKIKFGSRSECIPKCIDSTLLQRFILYGFTTLNEDDTFKVIYNIENKHVLNLLTYVCDESKIYIKTLHGETNKYIKIENPSLKDVLQTIEFNQNDTLIEDEQLMEEYNLEEQIQQQELQHQLQIEYQQFMNIQNQLPCLQINQMEYNVLFYQLQSMYQVQTINSYFQPSCEPLESN